MEVLPLMALVVADAPFNCQLYLEGLLGLKRCSHTYTLDSSSLQGLFKAYPLLECKLHKRQRLPALSILYVLTS